MKFGVREIANIVFKAKADTVIGSTTFKKGEPVLYIDTAKTSTMEGAATTVYATGGRGNTRLIAWEGEKTLTFSVEDALLSPVGFSILSGAGLFQSAGEEEVHVHTTSTAYVNSEGTQIDMSDALEDDEIIDATAPIFVMVQESDGSLGVDMLEGLVVAGSGKKFVGNMSKYANQVVFVDYYVSKLSATVPELQIDAENFAGYYYVEADTLFRRQSDGVDMPAILTFPNVKIQSNFTFSMASTGDPSTFNFTMDAFPGYTVFDRTKQVLCVIQIVEDAVSGTQTRKSVMPHPAGFDIAEAKDDSTSAGGSEPIPPKPEKISDKVSVMGQARETGLNKKVSELITPETTINDDGSVEGELLYVSGWEEFNPGNVEEQSGHYFPVLLTDKYKNTPITVTSKKAAKTASETEWVLRVSGQDATFKFEANDEELFTLKFTTTTMGEPPLLDASATVLSADNVPKDNNQEAAKANQQAISISNDGLTYTVSGDLEALQEYKSTDPTQSGQHKWIGIVIDTGEDDITKVKVDSKALTAKDVQDATDVGASAGSFILWLRAEDVVINSRKLKLSMEHKSDTTITIKFTNTHIGG